MTERALTEEHEERVRERHRDHPYDDACYVLAQLDIERAAHKLDRLALQAQARNLTERVKFLESVMRYARPHNADGRRCKVAEGLDLACCNPECKGNWGTGCWCCHGLAYAIEVDDPELMKQHLQLAQQFEEKRSKSR
jgi:hypothetical protein